MVFLNLLTFGLWGKLGRLTHYAVDAVLISTILAGMRRSTGLSFKTERISVGENKDANKMRPPEPGSPHRPPTPTLTPSGSQSVIGDINQPAVLPVPACCLHFAVGVSAAPSVRTSGYKEEGREEAGESEGRRCLVCLVCRCCYSIHHVVDKGIVIFSTKRAFFLLGCSYII
ncbi:hypothetical protein F5B20DRAFT_188133 [Whalleya microplaca]|nr:hypothetical protein F5B20DRAFT_188133 [Whalleya microplaca]